jgi:hypothetical protein
MQPRILCHARLAQACGQRWLAWVNLAHRYNRRVLLGVLGLHTGHRQIKTADKRIP